MASPVAYAPACDESGVFMDTAVAVVMFALGYLFFTPRARLATASAFCAFWDCLLAMLPSVVAAKAPKFKAPRAVAPRANRTLRVVPMAPVNIVHA